jgi:NAD(P)-dependent dehydrogenase (short-subunit alcohol dehydrogenase family)
MDPLAARTVLITGASRGIGRAAAVRLAAEGWWVWASMRDLEARAGVERAAAAAGASVQVLAIDVRDPSSITAGVQELLARTSGRLDAVVVNAGVFAAGAFEDTPPDVMRTLMETNYFGAIETVRATLPALRRSRGRIAIISSDSGLTGTPALSGYTATKYALEGWGESLAYELAPLGVSLSLIEPGAFGTGIWSSAFHRGAPDSPYVGLASTVEASLQALGAQAPPPDPVASTLVRALDARRPRLRYTVGKDAWRMRVLKRVLPDRAIMRITRRAMGLSNLRSD